MKFSYFKQIVLYMQRFDHIVAVYRLNDSSLRIVFNRENSWNFELNGGDSGISIGESASRGKMYQAPFDMLLAKRFNRSTVQSISMHNNDKILRITAGMSGSYKSLTTTLQLEFTGKHTNAIILDEEGRVLEALRHIDEEVSSRSVRVGQILLDPPPIPYEPKEYPLEDVRGFLVDEFNRRNNGNLERLKKEKLLLLNKRLIQLKKHLNGLENESLLLEEAQQSQHIGHLILANLASIRPYDTEIVLDDFDGTPLKITLAPRCPTPSSQAEHFFKRSKKGKQKAIGLYRERHNLEEKIRHLELFIQTVNSATTPEEITLLFPQKGEKSRLKTSDSIAQFWIEGVKVSLGKSEKGNIELLQNAKARDIWMHLKDRPSAHVIISTDKQQLPEKILVTAAKLCVDFSVFEKGAYLVDYTSRREVRVQEGANVLYNNYKTISISR
jgi:predicted ribosome quality control (RQC) complex YloA/Tae2 family protein